MRPIAREGGVLFKIHATPLNRLDSSAHAGTIEKEQ